MPAIRSEWDDRHFEFMIDTESHPARLKTRDPN